jgi:hypothetical protein
VFRKSGVYVPLSLSSIGSFNLVVADRGRGFELGGLREAESLGR